MWCRSWNPCKPGGHGISSKIPEPWNKLLYCLGEGQMPWNMFHTQKVTLASCWVGGSFICDTCYVFCIILSSDFPHSIVIILQMSFIFCNHHLLNCTACSFRVEIVFSTSPYPQMLAECLKKCRLLVSACQQITKLLNVWMNICIGKAMHFCWMLNEWTDSHDSIGFLMPQNGRTKWGWDLTSPSLGSELRQPVGQMSWLSSSVGLPFFFRDWWDGRDMI